MTDNEKFKETIRIEISKLKEEHRSKDDFVENGEYLRDYYTFISSNAMYPDSDREDTSQEIYDFITNLIEEEDTVE